jgi:hypothetical protein
MLHGDLVVGFPGDVLWAEAVALVVPVGMPFPNLRKKKSITTDPRILKHYLSETVCQ